MQRVVDELAAAGLLELRANPDHARSPLVRRLLGALHQPGQE